MMSKISNEYSRPMTGIESPDENDVPMGRGGFVNSHSGHRRYMKMVEDKKLEYVKCKKADKMEIAWSIVHQLRALNPPARFLRKDPATGLWNDVGDKKFREKVSQALREHQPFIKAVIDCADPEPLPVSRSTDGAWELPTEDQDKSVDSTDCKRPSLCVAADKRRAFLSIRNERNVSQVEILPAEEGAGFTLSDFSVSQGPSFPDFDDFASVAHRRRSSGLDGLSEIQSTDHDDAESVASRRRSSASTLAALFEILNDRRNTNEDIDALFNEANAGLSVAHQATNDCYVSDEKLALDCQFYPRDMMDNAVPRAVQRQEVSKRSSVEEENCDSYSPGPVKRCVLGRDKSDIARKLKEAYCKIAQAEALFLNCGAGEQGMDSILIALEKSFPFTNKF